MGFTSGYEMSLLDFDVFVKTKCFLHESLTNVILRRCFNWNCNSQLRVLHGDGIHSSFAAV